MNARKRRMKGKKRQGKGNMDFIIIRIPKDNPEPTIRVISQKYSCECKKK